MHLQHSSTATGIFVLHRMKVVDKDERASESPRAAGTPSTWGSGCFAAPCKVDDDRRVETAAVRGGKVVEVASIYVHGASIDERAFMTLVVHVASISKH